MEEMKADMAGAAVVTSLLFALAKNKLPLHVIGLIPATDNRPGENAIAPGDVITYMNGKTVEVLNTDAEGRLILADALCYASRYNPELVIDLATLTGSAVKALGKEAIAMMGSADKSVKFELEKTGHEIYERLVELPLWNEYNEQILSDVADLKNIGSEYAGAITAGKFLEHFTDYPWIHLDIAGVAYLSAKDHYRSKYATGIGVRLIYNFLKKQ
jgi:leucyl aminopeptidase